MKIVLILGVMGALLAACGGDDDAGNGGRIRVAAAFYPLAEAARQVGGDLVDVTDLTPPGAEPHDLELSPEDVDAVLDADLAVVMGRGFQPAVEDVAEDRDGPNLYALGSDDLAGAPDPHVWLDPHRFAEIVDAMATSLAGVDGAHADRYRTNASTYTATLDALDGDMRDGLAHCERTDIVTAHAAYGWLATRYRLTQHAIAGVSPDQEPDPKRLAELADLVRSDGVTTIFTEALVSPDVADSLAREAGVHTAVLNPLESQPEQGDYVSVMRDDLSTLRAALGCT